MRRFLLLAFLLLPLRTGALEYANLSLLYTDAPFHPGEAAGISLLTSIGAVQGNPDGTFAPNRAINRAEFLKIAIASHPRIRVSKSDAARCFRDVRESDWFSQYVCLAEKRGVVSGYEDGTFKPGRTVNYAEALKILSELYNYVAYSAEDEQWYEGYVRAATFNKTVLPVSLPYDQPLTRGYMARLAAAYRAHYEGELETYRRAEVDLDAVIVEQAEEEREKIEAIEAIEAIEEEADEGEVIEEEIVLLGPAKSTQLLLGETSAPIAHGMFTPQDGPGQLRSVTVKMWNAIRSIDALVLVDEEGRTIATLKLDLLDKEDRTWKAEVDPSAITLLPNEETYIGLLARMKERNKGGFPDSLVQVKHFSLIAGKKGDATSSYQLIAKAPFPKHQSTQAEITDVRSALPAVESLQNNESQLLAEFVVVGEALPGAELSMENLTFTMTKAANVSVTGWEIGSPGTAVRKPCSIESGVLVQCLALPLSIGLIENGERTVQLFGLPTVSSEEGVEDLLQLTLRKPGAIGEGGAIRWSDGQGSYTWVELPKPLAEGPVWR